jgi:hypothetical protein
MEEALDPKILFDFLRVYSKQLGQQITEESSTSKKN